MKDDELMADAEKKKNEGNEKYKNKNLKEAESLYCDGLANLEMV